MKNKTTNPKEFSLNEIRILRSSLSLKVRVMKLTSGREDTTISLFKKYGFISTIRGEKVYLLHTIESEDFANLVENISILEPFDGESKRLTEFPNGIIISFIRELINYNTKKTSIFNGGSRKYISPEVVFSNGHYAVNVDIRPFKEYFSIFLNPTIVALFPLVSYGKEVVMSELIDRQTLLLPEKPLPNDPDIGFIGYLDSLEKTASDSKNVEPGDIIHVRRTKKSTKTYKYISKDIKIKARLEEVHSKGLFSILKSKSQVNSSERFKLTSQWIKRLFPNNKIQVNNVNIKIENKLVNLASPSEFPNEDSLPRIWFPEKELLFSPDGDKTHNIQASGLKTFGPFDQNFEKREVNEIHPILIVPNKTELIQQSAQLFDYYAKGYKKRNRYDYDFPEISPSKSLRVKFTKPDEEDYFEVDGSINDYEKIADEILSKWIVHESKNQKRVVVVVIPDQYAKDGEDPYAILKRKFLEQGLPSQMIEISTLKKITNQDDAIGSLLLTFALNIYVKMGGKPWTLLRELNDVNCIIGVGFSIDLKEKDNSIYVGVANVFDQAGQWLGLSSHSKKDLTSAEVGGILKKEYRKKGTNSFKLQESFTYEITLKALKNYSHIQKGNLASKILFHKNGPIFEAEAKGIIKAIKSYLNDLDETDTQIKLGLVSIIQNHDLRMYGPELLDKRISKVITRGSAYIFNGKTALLATTGKVPIGQSSYKYSGIGTPRPLLIEKFFIPREIIKTLEPIQINTYSIIELCEHVMSLTRLHWGSISNIHLPVTSNYAQKIAQLLAKTKLEVDYLDLWNKLWWV